MRAGVVASARVEASGGTITSTYQTAVITGDDLTTYTFAARPIGAPSATRRVVVTVGWAQAPTPVLSSVTIGGVTATVDAIGTPADSDRHTAIVSAVVPAGTTADVVVTLSGGGVYLGIGVWTLSGGAPTGQTAMSTNTKTGTLNVTTIPGDVVICSEFAAVGTPSTPLATTWTDATERFDHSIAEGSNNAHSGADVVASGTLTSVGFSTLDATDNWVAACAAAYA